MRISSLPQSSNHEYIRFSFTHGNNSSFIIAIASVIGLGLFGRYLWYPKNFLEVLYTFLCAVSMFFIGGWLVSLAENDLELSINAGFNDKPDAINEITRKLGFTFWAFSFTFGLASVLMVVGRKWGRIVNTPGAWCFDWCLFLVITLLITGSAIFHIHRLHHR